MAQINNGFEYTWSEWYVKIYRNKSHSELIWSENYAHIDCNIFVGPVWQVYLTW